ncbi:MAG: BREX system Lon protease-like protein BrxL [Candidatus Lokiarchaeota archaeon]|nr:BREX system Lon protease-like protein BrxL [Candidatus Lokiarchaeota archaeon]
MNVKNKADNKLEHKTPENYTEKVKEIFPETSINKELVQNTRVRDLPNYIFEWLLYKFTDEGVLTQENKKKLYKLIEKHYPDPENLEYYKYQIIKEREKISILNRYDVSLNARTEEYTVNFPFFASESRNVHILEEIVDQNKGLLNGLWGISTISHDPTFEKPFLITDFSPVQIEEVYLDKYIEARKNFTLPEWVNLMINTMGLNPEQYPTAEEKIYLISRIIPYVQNNFNLVEMGPKGTGKSYFHKNISTHVHVIGGGTISRAELIFHMGKKKKGLLLTNDVVVFDDFSNIKISGASEVIGKLKNFMADGIIDVGSFKETSNASVVIMGNIALTEHGFPANKFYFGNLPKSMQESAFLDRMSAFIPGWRLHPVRPKDLSKDYGLIGDWFSEILHHIRKKSFIPDVENMIEFKGKKARVRDSEHMKATAAGLIKLLFPDGKMDLDDWHLIAKFAVNLRQRVITQLGRIDPEFLDIQLDYDIIE